MPQTKRKRRTKHRGNAAGTIEVRGRTGRKPRPEEMRSNGAAGKASTSRPTRGTTPPTWKAAFAKACFGAVMLFAAVKFGILGGAKKSTLDAATFAAVAAVLYTPVMFATDKFVYARKQKQLAPKPKP